MLPNHHFILATPIAEHGVDPHHDEAVRFMAELRRNDDDDVDHDDLWLDHHADPAQPTVDRQGAFGRLRSHLAHLTHRHAVAGHARAA